MGFWSRLFGFPEKKAERTEKRIPLSEVNLFLDQKLDSRLIDLRKKLEPGFNEINSVLVDIEKDLKAFRERNLEEEEGHKKLRKIVQTSKTGFLNKMNSLVQKLRPPRDNSFESLEEYCLNSSAFLSTEVASFWKNIRYTGVLMSREVKGIGEYVNELNSIFLNLRESFNSGSLSSGFEAKELLKELGSLVEERASLASAVSAFQREIDGLLEERNSVVAGLESLLESTEARELDELVKQRNLLLDKKEEMRNEFVSLLSPLDKPLHRFLKLACSGNFPLEKNKQELLNAYLDAPTHAMDSDQQGIVLKELLVDLTKLIEEDTVSLKDKEKPKKLQELNFLLAKDFSGIFFQLNSLNSELAFLDKKIAENRFNEEKKGLESKLDSLARRVGGIGAELEANKASLRKKENEIVLLKEKIEVWLSEALSEHILILIDLS